jgi:hypothetical protein
MMTRGDGWRIQQDWNVYRRMSSAVEAAWCSWRRAINKGPTQTIDKDARSKANEHEQRSERQIQRGRFVDVVDEGRGWAVQHS